MTENIGLRNFFFNEVVPFVSAPLSRSELGRKLLYAILFFSTIITLILTSIQIYLDYRTGVNGIYQTINQIKLTQFESLTQNLWNINNEQIQIQLRGLLEIPTVNSLTIFPADDEPIRLEKRKSSFEEIVHEYPLIYEGTGKEINLGTLKIISDTSPVVEDIKSRILVILLAQGTKTFVVSLFILFIFHILVSKHLIAVSLFAKKTSLDTIGKQLVLNRSPQEQRDELDELAENLNLMQDKIRREVNQRKGFQEQLLQSQKMEALGTLASGIAHDFNNILQGLYNALFLIEEEVIDNADALQKLNTANHLVDRASELVKQILVYTRHEEGILAQFSPVPPVQDVVEILRAAKESAVTVDLFIDPPNGKVFGDKTQLKQVLLNLGNNSLQALEGVEKPKLQIFLRSRVVHEEQATQKLPQGNYLEIRVSDNGHGISEEIQKRIFEPFFTTKEIDKGTGLGLSVVQGIIDRHNGHIEVESRIQKGTTFTLFFPLLKKSSHSFDSHYSGGEKVFIISTNTKLRETLSQCAQDLGHPIEIFKKPDLCLSAIKAEAPSEEKNSSKRNIILIVDQYLGDLSPEELIRKVRHFNAEIPILFLGEGQAQLPINLRVAKRDRHALVDGEASLKDEDARHGLKRLIQSAYDVLH